MYNVHVFSTIDTESLDLDENGIVTWPVIYMTTYDIVQCLWLVLHKI